MTILPLETNDYLFILHVTVFINFAAVFAIYINVYSYKAYVRVRRIYISTVFYIFCMKKIIKLLHELFFEFEFPAIIAASSK